jgi:hypothetical protein
MSGRRGSGPRARASATCFSNSLFLAAGTLPSQAAWIRATASFSCFRRSRSARECFAKGFSLPLLGTPNDAPPDDQYGRTFAIVATLELEQATRRAQVVMVFDY